MLALVELVDPRAGLLEVGERALGFVVPAGVHGQRNQDPDREIGLDDKPVRDPAKQVLEQLDGLVALLELVQAG